MGAAPMAYSLFTKELRTIQLNQTGFNRDRFILSAGHGSMLLYALLHLSGFEMLAWMRSRASVNGVQKHQVTQNLAIRQGLMLRQVL